MRNSLALQYCTHWIYYYFSIHSFSMFTYHEPLPLLESSFLQSWSIETCSQHYIIDGVGAWVSICRAGNPLQQLGIEAKCPSLS